MNCILHEIRNSINVFVLDTKLIFTYVKHIVRKNKEVCENVPDSGKTQWS